MPPFLSWPLEAVSSLVDEGGPFVIGIYLCGVVMWAIVIERAWYFARVLPKQARATIEAWQARGEHRSWCARQIRAAMVSRVNHAMNANLLLLRVLVPLSPLLGLVGTVSGMLEVFDSMAMRGSADARAMASGVSMAMICTLTGLMVSITGLYPVHSLSQKVWPSGIRPTEGPAARLRTNVTRSARIRLQKFNLTPMTPPVPEGVRR